MNGGFAYVPDDFSELRKLAPLAIENNLTQHTLQIKAHSEIDIIKETLKEHSLCQIRYTGNNFDNLIGNELEARFALRLLNFVRQLMFDKIRVERAIISEERRNHLNAQEWLGYQQSCRKYENTQSKAYASVKETVLKALSISEKVFDCTYKKLAGDKA